MKKLFTSESVTEGHPDKVCDGIADAILDDILSKDKNARVACEVCATTDFILIMGEITTTASCDYEKIARQAVKEIGYDEKGVGFDCNTCEIIVKIKTQSPDIAMGVNDSVEFRQSKGDIADEIGAGDQGMMFGYACSQTEELMPLPIVLAHKITRRLTEVRKKGIIPYLRPDGKSQVTVEYVDGKPVRVDTVVVSTQHKPQVDMQTLKNDVLEKVVKYVIDDDLLDENTKYFVNPTGRFEVGGPMGDSGLTGRKIIVDTYGGYCAHGGGSFSGKDPTKVDRSATYYARYVAKNVVKAGLCKECFIELAYAIGVAKPVSVYVNTYSTGIMSDEELTKIIVKEFDFRPYSIIEKLDLRKPVYKKTSNYGHFGNGEFSWEKTDKVDDLKKYL